MRGDLETASEWSSADSKYLQILAYILAGQNREQMACDLLEYALSNDRGNGEIMKALAGAYFLLGRFDDAVGRADQALAADQTAADAAGLKLIKSRAFHALGRTDDAERLMSEYVAERPD